MREDVLEMIVTASRLPDQLGLDIRAFIATVNVANRRVSELVQRYGAKTITEVDAPHDRLFGDAAARAVARIARRHRACGPDFIEHDGQSNVLYKIDCKATKTGDTLTLDFSGSSKQAPGLHQRDTVGPCRRLRRRHRSPRSASTSSGTRACSIRSRSWRRTA